MGNSLRSEAPPSVSLMTDDIPLPVPRRRREVGEADEKTSASVAEEIEPAPRRSSIPMPDDIKPVSIPAEHAPRPSLTPLAGAANLAPAIPSVAGPLPVPRRSRPPESIVTRAKKVRKDPVASLAGWASFVAWVCWLWGLALADSARPAFRVVGGLDRMFGVRRSAFGNSQNLTYALVLFGVAVAIGGLGAFLVSSLRQEGTKLPWHLVTAAAISAVTFLFYALG